MLPCSHALPTAGRVEGDAASEQGRREWPQVDQVGDAVLDDEHEARNIDGAT